MMSYNLQEWPVVEYIPPQQLCVSQLPPASPALQPISDQVKKDADLHTTESD